MWEQTTIWKWLIFTRERFVVDIKNCHIDMSRDMRFPTMWYVRPAKAQTSLH